MDANETMIYRVQITIDSAIESEWLDWMQRVHVPEVLRTGCFTECRILKVLDDTSAAAEMNYVLTYRCRSRADYEQYRDHFAPALQKDHTARYAGRFRGARQLLEEIATLNPEPPTT